MVEKEVSLFEAITLAQISSPSAKTNALQEFKMMILDFQEKINELSLQEFYDYLLTQIN